MQDATALPSIPIFRPGDIGTPSSGNSPRDSLSDEEVDQEAVYPGKEVSNDVASSNSGSTSSQGVHHDQKGSADPGMKEDIERLRIALIGSARQQEATFSTVPTRSTRMRTAVDNNTQSEGDGERDFIDSEVEADDASENSIDTPSDEDKQGVLPKVREVSREKMSRQKTFKAGATLVSQLIGVTKNITSDSTPHDTEIDTEEIDVEPNGSQSSFVAVTEGDVVYFDTRIVTEGGGSKGAHGSLHGSSVLQRCGVQEKTIGADPLNQYECLFRVYPQLSFKAQREAKSSLRKRPRRGSRGSMRQSISLFDRSTSDTDDSASISSQVIDREAIRAQQELLLKRGEQERVQNDTIKKRTLQGKGNIVQYGMIVMLQHVQSNLFLGAYEFSALRDPDCRRISLSHGDPGCTFRILPRYKVRPEGSAVYFGDAVIFEAVQVPRHYLHVSPILYDDSLEADEPKESIDSLKIMARTSSMPISDSLRPTFLSNAREYEANTSPTYSTFTIKNFAKQFTHTTTSLSVMERFRLYSPQAQAFVHASCDAAKERRYRGSTITRPSPDGFVNRVHNLPPHLPYLRKIDNIVDVTNVRHMSAKAVWTFEFLSRTTGGAITWEKALRIRHVPSGRYLAVNTEYKSARMHKLDDEHIHAREDWYDVLLVDGHTISKNVKETNSNVAGSRNSTTFFLQANEETKSPYVTHNQVTVRIVHRFKVRGGKQLRSCYLHDANEVKPKFLDSADDCGGRESTTYRSGRLVFSTRRHTEDVFTLLQVDDTNRIKLDRIISCLPVAKLYSYLLEDKSRMLTLPSVKDVDDEITMLLTVIADCNKRSNLEYWREDFDWVRQAEQLPAEFAQFFDDDSDLLAQRFCRETKVIDAIFDMTIAPYTREAPKRPFSAITAKGPSEKRAMRAVQKLAYVALQRVFANSEANQLYFARSTNVVNNSNANGLDCTESRQKWIVTLTKTLEDPLGSAVTLSELLSTNEQLLHTFVTDDLIDNFAIMIENMGPQPRLINFFAKVCTVSCKPIKKNQEKVFRRVFIHKEKRERLLLDVMPKNDRSLEYRPLPNARFAGLESSSEEVASITDDYLGKGETREGRVYPAVFLRWFSNDLWKDCTNELFFSPKALGMETLDGYDGLVRIEHFCWVLQPKKFCPIIVGQTFDEYWRKIQMDSASFEAYENHRQLAQYFVSQLELFAQLCLGRSYNCINYLTKEFDYITLLSIARNQYIPGIVRKGSFQLLRVLYLDRFPHLKNCGRPALPELLWIINSEDDAEEKDKTKSSLSIIHRKRIEDSDALPSFQITERHPLHKDPDPLMSFPRPSKFFLLRNLVNRTLMGLDGRFVASDRGENNLMLEVMHVVCKLASFGFLSSVSKIKELVDPMVRLLDGRDDILAINENGEEEEYSPSNTRWKSDANADVIAAVKVSVIEMLTVISNIRENFRLSQLLCCFQEIVDTRKVEELIDVHDVLIRTTKEQNGSEESDLKPTKDPPGERKSNIYRDLIENNGMVFGSVINTQAVGNDLATTLNDAFEDLFTKGDGLTLDLQELAGEQDLEALLLDCMMYENDDLFEGAFQLLQRRFGQRKCLVESLKKVVLVPQLKIPVFGSVDELQSRIAFLWYLVRSTEVWAVSSKLSGHFNEEHEKIAIDTLEKIMSFLHSSSGWDSDAMKVPQPRLHRKSSSINRTSDSRDRLVSIRDEFGVGKTPSLSSLLNVPNHEHQELLRAMDFADLISHTLKTNYNIAFEGSVCSYLEKVLSREKQIKLMRMALKCIGCFVTKNSENQHLLADELTSLRALIGPLKLPNLSDVDIEQMREEGISLDRIPEYPTLGVEELIIEIVRDNPALCSQSLNIDFFHEFGNSLNACSDPSQSNLLSFFETACFPKRDPVPHNQMSTIDIFLSDEFPRVKDCIERVVCGVRDVGEFDFENEIENEGHLFKPWRILRVLSSALEGRNAMTASRLAQKGLSIDVLVNNIVDLLDDKLSAGADTEDGDKWMDEFLDLEAQDYHQVMSTTVEMVHLLSLELKVLALNQRLLDDERLWSLIKYFGRFVNAFVECREVSFELNLKKINEYPHGLKLSSVQTPNVEGSGVIVEEIDVNGQAFVNDRLRAKQQKMEIDMDSSDLNLREQNKDALIFLGPGCRVMSISETTVSSRDSFQNEIKRRVERGDAVCRVYWKDPEGRTHKNHFLTDLCCFAIDALCSICTAAEASGAFNADHPERSESLTKIYKVVKIKSQEKFVGIPESFQQVGMEFLRLYQASEDEGNDMLEIAEIVDTNLNRSVLPGHKDIGVREAFRMFTEIVSVGPEEQIKNRKYQLIELLENAESVSTRTPINTEATVDKEFANAPSIMRPSLLSSLIPSTLRLSSDGSGSGGDNTDTGTRSTSVRAIESNSTSYGSSFLSAVSGSKSSAASAEIVYDDETGHHMDIIKISWDDLVVRMANYIRNHLFEPNKSCQDIIDILICHLRKIRDIDGTLSDISEMSLLEKKKYVDRQNSLNRHGAAGLMAEILTINRVGQDGDFADMAIELLAEMLNGGNKDVQQAIFNFATTQDPKGSFLSHIKDRLSRGERAVRERRDSVRAKYVPFTEELMKEYKELIQTLKFMQLMCEGHTLDMQNLMRTQHIHGSAVSINLLAQSIDLLSVMVESSATLRRFDEMDVNAAEACLNFLIEALQGPCPDNQLFVVTHMSPAPAIEVCKQIIPSPFSKTCSKDTKLRFQGCAVKFLAACLEGRRDSRCHDTLAELVEADMIRVCRQTIIKRYENEKNRTMRRQSQIISPRLSMTQNLLLNFSDESDATKFEEEKRMRLDDAIGILVDLQSVTHELESTVEFLKRDHLQAPALQRESKRLKIERFENAKALDFVKDKIGTVEIFWNGRTESVCFPLPLTHRCLQASTKMDFLHGVDLSTTEKRMKELIVKAEDFFGEMKHLYQLEEKSPQFTIYGIHFNAYKFLKANLPEFKRYVYFFNVVLNVTVLAKQSLWEGSVDKGLNDQGKANSGLVMILLFGYTVISGYYILAEFPVLWGKLLKLREESQAVIDDVSWKKSSESKKFTALRLIIFGAFYWTLVGTIHDILPNGPENEYFTRFASYLFLFLFVPMYLSTARTVIGDGVIFRKQVDGTQELVSWELWMCLLLPMALASIRDTFSSYILQRKKESTFQSEKPWEERVSTYALRFCVVYDGILNSTALQDSLTMLLIVILGCFYQYFHCLLLLDIFFIIDDLKNIVAAIVHPIVALGWTFYVFVCSAVIYGTIGFVLFRDDFMYDEVAVDIPANKWQDGGDLQTCTTPLTCFWLVLYKAVPAGDIGGIIDDVDRTAGLKFNYRVIFDLSFFMWFGIILFNIITGIIVDTFSELRNTNSERMDRLANECFVCGFTRAEYEDRGPGYNFEVHMHEDHMLWNYLFFLAYLQEKDENDYNGVETYVSEMLKNENLDWLPNHTSWRVERLEGKEMEEDSIPSGMKSALKGLEDSLRHHLEKEIAPGIQRTLDSFRQELEKIKSEIQQHPQRK